MAEFPLVRRFQRCRWSETRKRINALKVGKSVIMPDHLIGNISTTIQRLQEAYDKSRRWSTKKVEDGFRVTRTL